VKQWAYHRVSCQRTQEMEARLRRLRGEGWILITLIAPAGANDHDGIVAFLKRQTSSPTAY